LDDRAIVMRFRPTDPDAVLGKAEVEFRRAGHYGLSVFADVQRDGETEADVLRRLLAASLLDRIALSNNKRIFVCAQAVEITSMGFAYLKDDEADELDEHYCIDLGPDPTLDRVRQLLGAFAAHDTAGVLG
jgi:hypothetical protein